MSHISRFVTRRLRELLMRVTPTLSLSINRNKNIPRSPPILLSIFFSKKMKANFFFLLTQVMVQGYRYPQQAVNSLISLVSMVPLLLPLLPVTVTRLDDSLSIL